MSSTSIFNEAAFREILLPSSDKVNDKKENLTTKWVAEAWDKNKKKPYTKKHSFLKYGLPNNLDKNKDDQSKLEELKITQCLPH